ncbi:hypothetical protein BDF14DRAFT_1759661 [Spinellus fusiger]|nr:hypothetical protein BDF14DRAFT_1759661 [Spinellus fusiger]
MTFMKFSLICVVLQCIQTTRDMKEKKTHIHIDINTHKHTHIHSTMQECIPIQTKTVGILLL